VEERASSPVHSVPHSALPQAFPEKSSGPVLCPRLQLRGSAGIAPASLSSSSEEDARTCFKSLRNILAQCRRRQTFFLFTQGHRDEMRYWGIRFLADLASKPCFWGSTYDYNDHNSRHGAEA